MIKFLFFFISFLFLMNFSFAASFTDDQKQVLSYENLYTNGGAEAGLSGWSETGGGTLALESTTKRSGKKAIKFTSSAASDTLNFPSVTVKKGTNNCESTFYYYSTTANFVAKVYYGANEIASIPLPANTDFTKTTVTFICPLNASAYQTKATGGLNTEIVYVDDGWIGEYRNQGTVQQANFVGQITWPAASNCIWTLQNQSSLAAFAADSDCTTPTGTNLIGRVEAPAAKVPGVTIPFGGKGRYVLVATGAFRYKNTDTASGQNSGSYRFYDGSNYSSNAKEYNQNWNSSTQPNTIYGTFSKIVGEFDEEAFTNKTFQIHGATPPYSTQYVTIDANDDGNSYSSGSPLTISVYYYPSASEQVVRSENANTFGAVEWINGTYFSATGADATLVHSASKPSPTNTFGAASSDGTNNLTLVAPYLAVGDYEIILYGFVNNNGDGVDKSLVVSDGTTTKPFGPMSASGSSVWATSNMMVAYFNYTSIQSNKVFTIKTGSSNSGTVYCAMNATDRVCGISIKPVRPTQATPQFVNSVGTSYSGMKRSESALIAGGGEGSSCSSNPCTTYREFGDWISSVTRSGTGDYSVVLNSGIFSSTPNCVTTLANDSNKSCRVNLSSPSITPISVYCFNTSTLAAADTLFVLNCDGPK